MSPDIDAAGSTPIDSPVLPAPAEVAKLLMGFAAAAA
jgi:hypothetical protein